MRLMCFLLILPLELMFLGGCSQRIVYQEVLIPTKCEVKKRERPSKSGVLSKDIKAIFAYTQSLEVDLKVCRGEK